MSETVQNLVQAIQAGDAIETEQAFANAMAEKLSTRLDDMRQSVAQGMFLVYWVRLLFDGSPWKTLKNKKFPQKSKKADI